MASFEFQFQFELDFKTWNENKNKNGNAYIFSLKLCEGQQNLKLPFKWTQPNKHLQTFKLAQVAV